MRAVFFLQRLPTEPLSSSTPFAFRFPADHPGFDTRLAFRLASDKREPVFHNAHASSI
jgi:hypothetical protein